MKDLKAMIPESLIRTIHENDVQAFKDEFKKDISRHESWKEEALAETILLSFHEVTLLRSIFLDRKEGTDYLASLIEILHFSILHGADPSRGVIPPAITLFQEGQMITWYWKPRQKTPMICLIFLLYFIIADEDILGVETIRNTFRAYMSSGTSSIDNICLSCFPHFHWSNPVLHKQLLEYCSETINNVMVINQVSRDLCEGDADPSSNEEIGMGM